MTQLETLIQTLCPNGVHWSSVNDLIKQKIVHTVSASIKLKRNDYLTEGATPIISQEEEFISGYTNVTDKNITERDYVCFGDHSEHIKYVDFAFVQGADGLKIMYCNQEALSAKYFYYAVSNFYKKHCNYERHFKYLQELQIPLPPLAVQSEIVRILDKFTLYKSELAAELAARLQQYEYYRDKLLTFDDTVKRVKLGEVGFYPTERIAINEVESYVGVENLLKDRNGVEFLEKTPKMDVAIQFLPNDILIGNIRPYLKKIWIADRMGGTNGDVVTVRIKPEYIDKLNPKYLYHQLASDAFFNYDNINAKGAKMPRGDKNAILQYPIPLPPLSEQERIVSILDRFDKLCHDIREGLPAEIELRQKQYEHYRDRLLNFERE